MVRMLHKQHALSDRFIAHMLARNIRIEEDLIDQLFNSSEFAEMAEQHTANGARDVPNRVQSTDSISHR
jgi:hypothetical protein